MSEYVNFYRGESTTPLGSFTFDDVINFDDKKLEKEHGFVQCVFPNPALSKMQPDAATQPFTEEAAQEMLRDPAIVARVRRMVKRMLEFWGMDTNGDADVSIGNAQRFNAKLRRANHNQLRMTRMLIFLRSMGWTELMDSVKAVLAENVPKKMKAMRFWMEA